MEKIRSTRVLRTSYVLHIYAYAQYSNLRGIRRMIPRKGFTYIYAIIYNKSFFIRSYKMICILNTYHKIHMTYVRTFLHIPHPKEKRYLLHTRHHDTFISALHIIVSFFLPMEYHFYHLFYSVILLYSF